MIWCVFKPGKGIADIWTSAAAPRRFLHPYVGALERGLDRHQRIKGATMEAEDLRLALERQRDENQELVETLLQLEKEHGQLQRDQSQLKEEVARLQHTQTMSEEPDGILEELSALQTSLAEREQEIKVLKQQRQCLEAEKQELRCCIQELMTENLGLTKGNFRTHQQLLEAERALKQLKVDLQQAKDEWDKREKELDKEQHRSAELEEILREHAEIKEVLQGKINQLQDELEDSEQQKALRTSWYLRDVASPTGCGRWLRSGSGCSYWLGLWEQQLCSTLTVGTGSCSSRCWWGKRVLRSSVLTSRPS